jgi:hypothetical protein
MPCRRLSLGYQQGKSSLLDFGYPSGYHMKHCHAEGGI